MRYQFKQNYISHATGQLLNSGTAGIATIRTGSLHDRRLLGHQSRRCQYGSLGKRDHGVRNLTLWCWVLNAALYHTLPHEEAVERPTPDLRET